MENVPYLMILFLITVVAALMVSARSYHKADKAQDRDDSEKPKLRMAVAEEDKSPMAGLISDMIAEREAAARSKS